MRARLFSRALALSGMPTMPFFEVVIFWVFLAMLAVGCFAGYLWMTRPRTSMLDQQRRRT
jgi:hypothetical protein